MFFPKMGKLEKTFLVNLNDGNTFYIIFWAFISQLCKVDPCDKRRSRKP